MVYYSIVGETKFTKTNQRYASNVFFLNFDHTSTCQGCTMVYVNTLADFEEVQKYV